MSLPLPIEPSEGQLPLAEPTRPAQLNPLESYRSRENLLPVEWALLTLVDRLSRNRGVCYAGQKHLAIELGIHTRYLRKVITKLRAKGLLAIVHRKTPTGRNETSLLSVCGEPGANLKPMRPSRAAPSGPPGPHRCGPPGPTSIKYPYQKDAPAKPAKDPARFGELFQARTPFSIWSYKPRDSMLPTDRLARAFREGLFRFVSVEGRVRVLGSIQAKDGGVYLFLLDESAPDAEPQRVAVPLRELGSWKFWR